jgi:steroid 5-alpha reductase family enzyme
MQAYANFAVLVIPGAIICNDKNPLNWIEIFGFALWNLSYAWESLADQQKLVFLTKKAKAKERNVVCNVGLWKYSRHPNYFGEWMVWNSLIVMTVPSI